ncbi:BRO1 domain-containing protein BROX isoform X1 [Frankliniella occidentalis]|uniref:BRO1 domain-containing protein BROX isoform X1 n=1 Tax=Frankliniella occidentalis TaxID=133901 RepID=A0A6J1SZD6_FRAOC|nr:BRO1 domain-containing protein BROX isoform X1 [Frankliniella occidentalis]
MAMWFHRNVLKATVVANFDFQYIQHDVDATKVACELKATRYKLLDMLPDPRGSGVAMEQALTAYIAVLQGMLEAPDGSGAPSKLRHALLFKWSHSLLGTTPQIQQDAVFEAANIIVNVAIWFMKHASTLCVKDEMNMDDAKEVHTAMRRAGGLFEVVQKKYLPLLREKAREGGDLDPRVVRAYKDQCTAEAQEVSVARAVELKHSPSLVSALANETAKLFYEADAALSSLDEKVSGQWRKYLQLKNHFYMAYAHTYCGENLLSQDKCGEAIRSLREAQTHYEKAAALCKDYASTKGPAPRTGRPDYFSFFKKLALRFKLTLEKCERENGFIYHQKIPNDAPDLEMKATYGLASPVEFQMPAPSPLWTPVAYAAIDAPRSSPNDPATSKAAAKLEGDLKPVNEVKVEGVNTEAKPDDKNCILQ